MNEVTITIPDLPPSINKLMRMHFRVRQRYQDKWSLQLLAATSKDEKVTLKAWSKLGEKVSISMHVVSRQLYDGDNLSSLGKIPLDCMKGLGWLQDDSPEFVCFEKPTQEKGKRKKITFTIRRLEAIGLRQDEALREAMRKLADSMAHNQHTVPGSDADDCCVKCRLIALAAGGQP